MEWILFLLCITALWWGGSRLDGVIQRRRRAGQVRSAETVRATPETSNALDQLQSDNRAAAKAAIQARRESQPKKKRSYHAGPTTRSRAVAPVKPVLPGIRRVAFDYMDQAGSITSREVTAERYRYGKLYAHCHLRRAERTFFLDSIIGGVVDTRTGEVMDKQVWAETLY